MGVPLPPENGAAAASLPRSDEPASVPHLSAVTASLDGLAALLLQTPAAAPGGVLGPAPAWAAARHAIAVGGAAPASGSRPEGYRSSYRRSGVPSQALLLQGGGDEDSGPPPLLEDSTDGSSSEGSGGGGGGGADDDPCLWELLQEEDALTRLQAAGGLDAPSVHAHSNWLFRRMPASASGLGADPRSAFGSAALVRTSGRLAGAGSGGRRAAAARAELHAELASMHSRLLRLLRVTQRARHPQGANAALVEGLQDAANLLGGLAAAARDPPSLA